MERVQFSRKAHEGDLKTFSVSVTADPSSRKLTGYATVWNVVGCPQPGQLAVMAPGSCVLPTYPVVMQYNHDSSWQLASEENSTLTVKEDDHGLAITASLDDTFIDDFVLTKVRRRTISGMSLGMFVKKTHKESRIITAADAQGNPELAPLVGSTQIVTVYDKWVLFEVTVTGIPVFPQTTVGTFSRSSDETRRELDRYDVEADLIGLVLD